MDAPKSRASSLNFGAAIDPLLTALEHYATWGTIGVDASMTTGKVENGDRQTVKVNQTELGAFWRGKFGNLYAFTRLSGALLKAKSSRTFDGVFDGDDFTMTADGEWSGWKVGGSSGASYDVVLNDRFTLRPKLVFDYQRLTEKGYDESGDSELALSVGSRTSSRLVTDLSLTNSVRLGNYPRSGVPLTLDVTGGWKFNLVDKLGATAASFVDYDDDGEIDEQYSFLVPGTTRKGGGYGELRLHGGGSFLTWSIGATGQKTTDSWSAGGNLQISAVF